MREQIRFRSLVGGFIGLTLSLAFLGFVLFMHMDGSMVFFAGMVVFVIACATFIPAYKLELDRQSGDVYATSVMHRKLLCNQSQVGEIHLTAETRGSGKSRRTAYPVSLVGGAGRWTARDCTEYLEARRVSESLARVFKLDIHDAGHGELQVRDHRLVDTSWAATAPVSEGALVSPPGRLKMPGSLPYLVVQLPNPGMGPLGCLTFFFIAFTASALMKGGPHGLYEVGIVLGLYLLLALPMLPMYFGTILLEASHQRLAVIHKLAFLRFRKGLDLARIEEIRGPVRRPDNGLSFLTDKEVIKVECSLQPEEVAWLKEALAKAVRG